MWDWLPSYSGLKRALRALIGQSEYSRTHSLTVNLELFDDNDDRGRFVWWLSIAFDGRYSSKLRPLSWCANAGLRFRDESCADGDEEWMISRGAPLRTNDKPREQLRVGSFDLRSPQPRWASAALYEVLQAIRVFALLHWRPVGPNANRSDVSYQFFLAVAFFLCPDDAKACTSIWQSLVYSGRMQLHLGPLAYHWALYVAEPWFSQEGLDVLDSARSQTFGVDGRLLRLEYLVVWKGTWFEVAGTGQKKTNGASNEIVISGGPTSRNGVDEMVFIQQSRKSVQDLMEFNSSWLQEHPQYGVHGDNCQRYVDDAAVFMCGPGAKARLPLNDHAKSGKGVLAWIALICLTQALHVCPTHSCCVVSTLYSALAGVSIPYVRHEQSKRGYRL